MSASDNPVEGRPVLRELEQVRELGNDLGALRKFLVVNAYELAVFFGGNPSLVVAVASCAVLGESNHQHNVLHTTLGDAAGQISNSAHQHTE